MTLTIPVRTLVMAAALCAAAPLQAQEPVNPIERAAFANPPKPVAPPSIEPIVLNPTGSPASEQWESFLGGTTVRNVTQPALYPVLPAKGKANGTALVIAPGGAFMSLAFDSEGLLVARRLAEQGVTCFVLKYRLDPTPVQPMAFLGAIGARFKSARPKHTRGNPIDSAAPPLAEQDGLAAIRYLRANAERYGIDKSKIGMIGFSAGGMTTMNVATAYDGASRPDFIGVIYGAAPDRPVPKDAPPAFIALAADDGLLGHASVPIFEAWREAGKSAELHIYAAGEHGFGMRPMGTTSDNWIVHFTQWMQGMKLLPR